LGAFSRTDSPIFIRQLALPASAREGDAMETRWRHAAGCVVLLGLAGQAGAAGRPSIAVVAYNQAGAAADVLARAKVEVTRIVAGAGVDVIWMEPAAVAPVSTFAIQLLIRPRAVGAPGSVMGTALGDTHAIGGLALIFFDRVLRSAHEREQDVACVLAYAMVHEMGHLLLPAPAHTPSGLMRAAWDGDDLRHMANLSMQFTPTQQAAIRLKAETCCEAAR
jgi:DNA-binding transcriptional regulator PaaX